MLWLLPDTPEDARFLNKAQKIRVVERLKSNQVTRKTNVFRWKHLSEALLDIKVWLICLFLVCVTICNSSITAVSV